VHKSLTPGRRGALHLWILSKELVSCNPSDAKDFEVASKLFGNFVHPCVALTENCLFFEDGSLYGIVLESAALRGGYVASTRIRPSSVFYCGLQEGASSAFRWSVNVLKSVILFISQKNAENGNTD